MDADKDQSLWEKGAEQYQLGQPSKFVWNRPSQPTHPIQDADGDCYGDKCDSWVLYLRRRRFEAGLEVTQKKKRIVVAVSPVNYEKSGYSDGLWRTNLCLKPSFTVVFVFFRGVCTRHFDSKSILVYRTTCLSLHCAIIHSLYCDSRSSFPGSKRRSPVQHPHI